MRRRLVAVIAAIALVACARGNGQAVPAASLAGRWLVTDGNLRASLTLTQRGDTVSGTGTYTLAQPAELGCGGETLGASGAVSLDGQIRSLADSGNKRQFVARFRFVPGDWSPPFIGALVGDDSVTGGLMSIDRGQCPLSFVRER